MIVKLESLDDARLDVFARLTDVQLRSRLEPEQAILIAESDKVAQRALAAGLMPVSLLMEEKWLQPLAGFLEQVERVAPGTPVFVLPSEELQRLTGFQLTRGLLAAFRRPAPLSVEEAVQDARLVAVLENITNHTNVGAIFRSAAALGADAVLVSPACYDPFYRRAVRVSMGTVFQVPWARIPESTELEEGEREGKAAVDIDASRVVLARDGEPSVHRGATVRVGAAAGVRHLKRLGFTVAAMALEHDSLELSAPLLQQAPRVALVFGTEGVGLEPATIAACDATVCIPMHHGVDSLNVAASSAVGFYALKGRPGEFKPLP